MSELRPRIKPTGERLADERLKIVAAERDEALARADQLRERIDEAANRLSALLDQGNLYDPASGAMWAWLNHQLRIEQDNPARSGSNRVRGPTTIGGLAKRVMELEQERDRLAELVDDTASKLSKWADEARALEAERDEALAKLSRVHEWAESNPTVASRHVLSLLDEPLREADDG